jgi:hypothetical protein
MAVCSEGEVSRGVENLAIKMPEWSRAHNLQDGT